MRGTVLVTGGAKRIGREICLRLSEEGFSIAIHYRNSEQEANQLVGDIESNGGKAKSLQCDLNDSDSVRVLIHKANESLGNVVGIVNNASFFSFDRIESLSEELWTEHMRVNAFAPLVLISELSKFAQEASWVVNVLDFKIESPNADYLSYTSSRFAMHGLTSALAIDLAPRIRVNSVAPGHVLTSDVLDADSLKAVQSQSPLEFGPSANDVSEAVLFLANSPSITGQTIFVDSGERFRQMGKDPAFDKERIN
ncbi:MAG: SDR family oxidoreductase [Candidatus Thalassarchaeaceae archaeon]|jgi:NAD(P)-dependent dehydrogenase (short-subunit alcohol dehydrogenase family)|nr:MAG: short-chain dehydrogenase [Marine Group II euryarchaeote MED-G35]